MDSKAPYAKVTPVYDGDNVSVDSLNDREMPVDEVVSKLGFGRFQIILQVTIIYMYISFAYQVLVMYFLADDPPWKCVVPSNKSMSSISTFCRENFNDTFEVSDANRFSKRCNLPRDEWAYAKDKKYSIVTEFDLVCSMSWLSAVSNAAFFVGWAFGGLGTGIFADKFGRKRSLNICLFFFIIFSVLSSFITQVWQLCVLRACIGVTTGTCITVTFIFLAEFMSNKHRSACLNTTRLMASVSLSLMAVVAIFCQKWRHLNLFLCIPAITSFFISLILPKSPRWLHVHGKKEEAENILKRIARINNKIDLKFSLKVSQRVQKKKQYSYIDLFRSCAVIKFVMAQAFLWFAGGIVSYTLSLESADIGGNIYMNLILSAVALVPGNFVAIFLCNKGRKKAIISTLLLTGIITACTAVTYVKLNDSTEKLRIALTTLGKIVITISFSGLFIWTAELYPTVIRTQGMTICQLTCRIGSAASPFMSSYLQRIYQPLPFIIICVISFLSAITGFVLPETRGKPTREKFEDILGDQQHETAYVDRNDFLEPLIKDQEDEDEEKGLARGNQDEEFCQ